MQTSLVRVKNPKGPHFTTRWDVDHQSLEDNFIICPSDVTRGETPPPGGKIGVSLIKSIANTLYTGHLNKYNCKKSH